VKSLPKRTLALLGLAIPVALITFGCKKEEAVTSYNAPKEVASAASADSSSDSPDQAEPIAAHGGLGYPGDLRWTLPAGWKQVPVPPNPVFMPVADIAVSADQPEVLLTISQMPDSPGARSVYANVSRWARQLKIEPPAEGDLSKVAVHMDGSLPLDLVTLESADAKLLGIIMSHAQDTWVFKLSGPKAVVEAQGPAFAEFIRTIHFDSSPASPQNGPEIAGPPAPQSGPPTPPASVSGSGATGLGGAQWVLPAGWTVQPSEPGSLRLATIRPGNGSAQIKVSKLGIIGGGLGANVSRWHGEVGLDPVDDEHADAGKQVKFANQTWIFHDYTGPANGGTREIIAMAEVAGNTWYFKLLGTSDEVGKLKADFDRFISSIKFP
jgi:hypothetical protein